MAKNTPVHEIRVGRIRAAIWANDAGREGVWFSVSISRLYRGDEGWKDANSFHRDDLPLVSKVTDMAYSWIWDQQGSTVSN